MAPKKKAAAKAAKPQIVAPQRTLAWDDIGTKVEQADFRDWMKKTDKKSLEEKKKKVLELTTELHQLEEKVGTSTGDDKVKLEKKLKKLSLQSEYLEGFVVLTPTRSRAHAEDGAAGSSADDGNAQYGAAFDDQVTDAKPASQAVATRRMRRSSLCTVS